MKMKAYTVCARPRASMFMVFWLFSQKKLSNYWRSLNDDQAKWSKVKTLEDKPRSGWPFFHKPCEKYYRKSCKYMRNNSTKQKGKKISTSHYRSKFRAQRYGDKLPKTVGKPWREKGGPHFTQAWFQNDLTNLYTKGGPAGKLTWCEPLETIWIIVDETTCKDPAPKTLVELRQLLRFAWKYVTLGTLWKLVHSIPHRLKNVRKHKGRHSGY